MQTYIEEDLRTTLHLLAEGCDRSDYDRYVEGKLNNTYVLRGINVGYLIALNQILKLLEDENYGA